MGKWFGQRNTLHQNMKECVVCVWMCVMVTVGDLLSKLQKSIQKNKNRSILIPLLFLQNICTFKVKALSFYSYVNFKICLASFFFMVKAKIKVNGLFLHFSFSIIETKNYLNVVKVGLLLLLFMNVNMLSPSLSKNIFYNRTTDDKENEWMNRAIQNQRITEFQSRSGFVGYEPNSY